MSEDMAWMILKPEGEGRTYRRPPGGLTSFTPPPSYGQPQSFPRDVVDYFVAKGWAEEVQLKREEAKAIKAAAPEPAPKVSRGRRVK